jgi:multicomponent K+:H+ antiporter subunit E
MRWRLSHPLLAVCLFVMWLLLTQSFSAGQLLVGAIVAVLASETMRALRPAPIKVRSVRSMLRLAGVVLVDILRSNIAVARIVLFSPRHRVSGFVTLPLDLRDQHGLTVLALIITATPGTMWIQFDRAKETLLVHVLDLVDEAEWVRLIKGRYETLLMEIFEQ